MKYDLEERLIVFSIAIMDIVESIPRTRSGNHIAGQLIRCGTSPAFNYGEAQSAESRNDFIHKLKVVLKELRETNICLTILERRNMSPMKGEVERAREECRQLISIFVKSISTAESNRSDE